MKLVKHLLDSKGREIISIVQDASVFDGDVLRGIVTERDYARKDIIKGRASESTPVADIMTTDLITASPDQTVNECMTLMTRKRIRHLPVIIEGKVAGMISIGDLVQAIISDQQEEIEQLEQYISG